MKKLGAMFNSEDTLKIMISGHGGQGVLDLVLPVEAYLRTISH